MTYQGVNLGFSICSVPGETGISQVTVTMPAINKDANSVCCIGAPHMILIQGCGKVPTSQVRGFK